MQAAGDDRKQVALAQYLVPSIFFRFLLPLAFICFTVCLQQHRSIPSSSLKGCIPGWFSVDSVR